MDPYSTPAGLDGTNWILLCPVHGDPCRKTRKVCEAHSRRHGEIEPLAYVHAWIPCAVPADAPPKATHQGQFPTQEMVDAFAMAHRAELEVVVAQAKAANVNLM